MNTQMVTLDAARALVAAAFIRNRTDPGVAATVAAALVAAEAEGLKGHGLSRVASYVAQAKAGKVDGFAKPAVEKTRPGTFRVDAANGFAYPALDIAIHELAPLARQQGVALAGVYRSHHCGVAGHPVERLAEAGLVAMLFANTPAAIAPWGGRTALFGTNPIAFACPLPGRPAMVIDLSMSKVARGNLVVAKQRGEKIPEGWALDVDGQSTTDPEKGLSGTMLPAGDAKGAMLALMVEVLAAGLTGANLASEASSFLDAKGPPPGTGQLLMAIDPAALGGLGRLGVLAHMIEGDDGARLPGSRRAALRESAARDGIAVQEALLREIESI